MRVITDWHLHSKFSRACSQELTLENNALWCEKKGVDILGTADFTHPKWLAEIKSKLEPSEDGVFKLKNSNSSSRFMLTTEISQIYKRGGQTRRIHNIVIAPTIEDVEKIVQELESRGCNLSADGRPIIGLDSEELMKILLTIDERILLIPAHAWTPWFSVFGSKSGFNSLDECFGEMSKYVYAIETGLSSDPLMNRSLSTLDSVMLISNSDAHSPRNFGREANVFDIPDGEKVNYETFRQIFINKDTKKFAFTIEFFPEEGKYHFDGHADCLFSCDPNETKKLDGRCPKCGKKMTIGVLSRVNELSDRNIIKMPKDQVPFKSIIPLEMIIADAYGLSSTSSKKVQAVYTRLIQEIGCEFYVLLDALIEQISAVDQIVAKGIERMRQQNVKMQPGYDGIFGKISLFSNDERVKPKQSSLFS